MLKYPNLGDGYGNAVILDENGVVVTAHPGKDLNLVTSGGGLPKANGVAIASVQQVISKTLTATQINALVGSPITLIPAPGNGLTLVVDEIVFVYDFAGSAFGNTTLAVLDCNLNNTSLGEISLSVPFFLDQTASQIADQFASGSTVPLIDASNQPYMVTNTNATDLTGGGTSTLTFTIYYRIVSA